MPAIKNRISATINGDAEITANLVAVDADDHKMANKIPISMFFNLLEQIIFVNTSIKIGQTSIINRHISLIVQSDLLHIYHKICI